MFVHYVDNHSPVYNSATDQCAALPIAFMAQTADITKVRCVAWGWRSARFVDHSLGP